MEQKAVHIVVIGGGFGGLTFCRHFKHPHARITIVDKHNHHLFQPLLYQVATAGLSAPEIAQPIRSILSDREDITVLLDEVHDLNLATKEVVLRKRTLAYDYLVMAAGGRTTYFGHPEWEQFAPGLKSLEDAIRIRREVLLAFERAENESDATERTRLMTIIVVGGGPTGVELAGAFSELARQVLRKDFRHIDPATAQIILIEASPRVLSNMDEDLQVSATEQLEKMGVHIRANLKVANITREGVELSNGEKLRAANVIWAAGVGSSPLGQKLGVELDRAGRVKVNPDLSVPGHPDVFVLGDMASLLQKSGKPVPGVSPAAMQMAKHAARIIEGELTSPGVATRPAFNYFDKGTMATIGRSAAVAHVGPFKFSGYPAWLAWLFIHLIFLVGFRNQVAVLWQWLYAYLTYKRGSRIITDVTPIVSASKDS
jgi:NADH dehydrogenase